jgi:hypothetical protein
MRAVGLAALAYFLVVFTLAFAMGIARALVIAPRIGELAGVLLEVPILVMASWSVARRLLKGRSFTFWQAAMMGAAAFAMTMASEAALSVLLRGQSVTHWVGTLTTPLGLAGLAGQIAFAVMPIFARDRRRDRPSSS